jgi:CheY-like chemotaxis protein
MAISDKPFDATFRRLKSKLDGAHCVSSPRSILFVEDETVLRTMVSRMLSYLGYKVTTAMNAEQALGIFNSRNAGFDILITDVILPKMDGKELYQQKNKKKPAGDLYLRVSRGDAYQLRDNARLHPPAAQTLFS